MLLYFFKYIILFNYDVVIVRMIGIPVHGNNVVDGTNACEKRLLIEEMCILDTPKVDDSKSRMNNHSIVGISSCSLTNVCKRLCEDNVRVNGIKGYSKISRGK